MRQQQLEGMDRALRVVGLALAFGLTTVSANAQQPSARSFALPADPDAVVLRLTEELPAIADGDGPSITVFAGGRVVVEYPAIMKRAGRYELRLTPEELRSRLAGWIDSGVADFDEARVRSGLSAAREARVRSGGALEVVHDAGITQVELNLANYGPAGGEARSTSRPLAKRIRWRALRSEAKRHAENTELQALARMCRDLEALMTSPSLVELDR